MTTSTARDVPAAGPPAEWRRGRTSMPAGDRKVVFASSLGTVFEWYDFYLYGSLAVILAQQFFSGFGTQSAFALALLAFAAGFVVRPLGALLFGHLGDLTGRKYTFIVTILVMGLSTFAVGVLPSYEAIGIAAPIILVVLRIAQGLALGGEYGGASVYVAEHAPEGRRGFYTAWIQTTATLGLFLSLAVVLGTRWAVGEAAFSQWGWRIPFIGSIVLLALSVWMRLSLTESPAFRRMKAHGRAARSPLVEAFGHPATRRGLVVALFGIVAGQAVIWYTSQFYALFFMTQVLKVDATAASLMLAVALVLGTPLFLVFGSWSDRIGRKPVILAGFVFAAVTTFPLFQAVAGIANPQLAAAQAASPVQVLADPARCGWQLNPLARDADFTDSCDIARRSLAEAGVPYTTVDRPGGVATVRVGDRELSVPDAVRRSDRHRYDEASAREVQVFKGDLAAAVEAAGYPRAAPAIPIGSAAWWQIVGILWLLLLAVTMVYGPLAAALTEMFPTRVRYTAMSLPYHVGNGWFGGLMPTIAFALVAHQGQLLAGLWYPVVVVALSALICLVAVRESSRRTIHGND
jgi:MFS family permease